MEHPNLEKIYAYFLGPKSENASLLEELIIEILRDVSFWRKNFHTSDDRIITESLKRTVQYQDALAEIRHYLAIVLADLKQEIPYYSPRYIGHQLSDQLIASLVGYFAGMMHNPNNVTSEASPVTTTYELEVSKDLSELVGYEGKTWGHLTSGGSLANLEAMWVARNIKYLPFAIRDAVRSLNLAVLTITTSKRTEENILEVDPFTLANLTVEESLKLREKLIKAYKSQTQPEEDIEIIKIIDDEINKHSLSGKGIQQFFEDLHNSIKPGIVLIPVTSHYSMLKSSEIIGVGKNHIRPIPINKHFQVDIPSLRTIFEDCLVNKIPIIAITGVLGTTEEGAIDNFYELFKLREEFKSKGLTFYLHADGAWGGYIRSLFRDANNKEIDHIGNLSSIVLDWPNDEIFRSFQSVKHCDSVTIDPHKLGYIPYPAGAIVFKNDIRDVISFKAPYIFRTSEEKGSVNIGQFIIEGSKPGAAAVSCWLSHRILPLNQTGYGLLIGKGIEGARLLYNTCKNDIDPDLQKIGVKLKILTDPPNTNLFCFIINKIDNTSLQQMNYWNMKIYDRLCYQKDVVLQTHEFMLSSTNLDYSTYGLPITDGSIPVEEHIRDLNIKKGEFEKIKKIFILRSTIMNPWISLARGTRTDYIYEFSNVLKATIIKTIYPEVSNVIEGYSKTDKNWFNVCVEYLESQKM